MKQLLTVSARVIIHTKNEFAVVTHCKDFVDPDTGLQTQTIESLWYTEDQDIAMTTPKSNLLQAHFEKLCQLLCTSSK